MEKATARSGPQEDGTPAGLHEEAQSVLVSLAVAKAKLGDRDAFAFLYARFADDVCRYANSIVRNSHDAEDVTQQVFAKLFAVIGSYEQREVPFLAWMLRVTRNAAVDQLRRRRSIPVAEIRGSVSDSAGESLSSIRALRAALGQLPHAQREVLVLRHLAGLSPREIALRTGRSEGAVNGLHHRGRKALIADLLGRGVAPVTAARRPSVSDSKLGSDLAGTTPATPKVSTG
jgi:RNA polymerase sigma-70 factor (ECF subfamily)